MNFLKIIIDKVGTMPLTVGIPVLYAQQEGYFKEAGLNVEVNIFASGAPINEAIAARDLKILVPLGVVAQYMVESYAANYGLTPDDIY